MSLETVSLSKIAKDVGVSRTTVSYVLNGKYRDVKIAPETAERVLESANRLGYRPNYYAKALTKNRTRAIGVLFPDISGSSAHQVMEGISEVFKLQGYEAMMAVSFWEKDRERQEMNLMLDKRVEGILAVPQPGSEQTFQVALDSGCPVVCMTDYVPAMKNVGSVTLDAQDSLASLLSHLNQVGRRDIRLLSVNYKSAALQEREAAFVDGLMKLGIDPEGRIHYCELSDDLSVSQKVREIMSLPTPPDALMCISDTIGMKVLSELASLGVKIPEELAVTGIGNMPYTDHPFFSLTTVDECRQEIGRRAAEMIIGMIDKKSRAIQPEHVRIRGALLTRQSSFGSYTHNLR